MQEAQPLAKSEEPEKAVQVQIAASKVVVHKEQENTTKHQSVVEMQEATKPQAKQAPAPEKVPSEPEESEHDDDEDDDDEEKD